MKKVKQTHTAAFGNVKAKKCAAAFSAAVVAVTSVTCIVQLAFDNKLTAHASTDIIGSREILELSESYLAQNAEKSVSMLELTGAVAFEEESETAVSPEELSTGFEKIKPEYLNLSADSDAWVSEIAEKETEENKTQETTTEANVISEEKTEYTFEELGISQISDIDVPDDILFDENGIPLNYSKKLTGRSTAYCMGHTTATGTGVHPGVVAVNPSIIPYGTKMYIVADDGSVYGYSSAEDTGGFIYWDNAPSVDLYMYGSDACYAWGNRQVSIYIF